MDKQTKIENHVMEHLKERDKCSIYSFRENVEREIINLGGDPDLIIDSLKVQGKIREDNIIMPLSKIND